MISGFTYKVIKGFSAAVISATLCLSTAYAYSPPPASNWFVLSKLRRPYISITFAPLLIPDELKFDGVNLFTFERFSGSVKNGNFTVEWSTQGSGVSQYRIVKITGMKVADPASAGLKMTFGQIGSADINSLQKWLQNNDNSHPTGTHIGDKDCNKITQLPYTGPYLCLISESVGFTPEGSFSRQLTQKIPLGGVYVEGNVGGGKIIDKLFVEPNSIVVGGTIGNEVYSDFKLPDYLKNNLVLDINNIKNKEGEIYEKAISAGTHTDSGYLAESGDIYLNSSNNKFTNINQSSFSTPPEGKLWYVGDNLTIANTTIHGAGTIVVESGKSVEIGPNVVCDEGTRFGIIASTSSFNIRTEANKGIGCGAYLNLSSTAETEDNTMIFSNPVSKGEVVNKGIFINVSSIKLPANLDDPYFINFDSYFARNPTVLFQELLKFSSQ